MTPASGKVASRPELDKLPGVLLPGDAVVVWKLDRLGRSIKDVIAVVTAPESGCPSMVEAMLLGGLGRGEVLGLRMEDLRRCAGRLYRHPANDWLGGRAS